MKNLKFLMLGFVFVLFASFATAMPFEEANKDHKTCATQLGITASDGQEISGSEFGACVVKTYIFRVIKSIQMIAGAVAALVATVVGFMFMNAKDPSEKKELGDKLKAIIVGLGIILLSVPLVQLFI